MWKLNNMFLSLPWIKEEVSKEMKKYRTENEKTTYENMWGVAKAVLRGKGIRLGKK